eukprot:scaffold1169_cov120-Cylindrotheca_fusiformis.AAC.39
MFAMVHSEALCYCWYVRILHAVVWKRVLSTKKIRHLPGSDCFAPRTHCTAPSTRIVPFFSFWTLVGNSGSTDLPHLGPEAKIRLWTIKFNACFPRADMGCRTPVNRLEMAL